MPQLVTIGVGQFAIHSERERTGAWPEIRAGVPAAGLAGMLADEEIEAFLAQRAFGGPQHASYPQYLRHADHLNRRSFGHDNAVIQSSACWNWALTGATNFGAAQSATMIEPNDLFNLQNMPAMYGISRGQYIERFASRGLRLCLNANQTAINAWLAMPQRNADEQRAKMRVLVKIMCAIKGITVAPGAATFYVCCQYKCPTFGLDDPGHRRPLYETNYDHWGLQISAGGAHQSLQTVPWTNGDVNFRDSIGIWKTNDQSFYQEWTQPGYDVVMVPVSALTPAQLGRIRALLDHNP